MFVAIPGAPNLMENSSNFSWMYCKRKWMTSCCTPMIFDKCMSSVYTVYMGTLIRRGEPSIWLITTVNPSLSLYNKPYTCLSISNQRIYPSLTALRLTQSLLRFVFVCVKPEWMTWYSLSLIENLSTGYSHYLCVSWFLLHTFLHVTYTHVSVSSLTYSSVSNDSSLTLFEMDIQIKISSTFNTYMYIMNVYNFWFFKNLFWYQLESLLRRITQLIPEKEKPGMQFQNFHVIMYYFQIFVELKIFLIQFVSIGV